jgi:Domain of Unknown Function (DUF748)
MGFRDINAALRRRGERLWRRRADYLWLVLSIAIALIAARAALPFIVKDYVNGRLHALEAYDGSVSDVDIGLWRGAYRIDGIEVVKRGAKQPTPFFDGQRVDFSVEWHSLLHGSLVAEAHFYDAKLNLVEGPNPKQSQMGSEEDWHDRLEELFPFHFNTIEIHDCTVTFRTPGIPARDALTARHVNGIITNITNVVETEKDAFAEFRMTGKVLGDADAWAYGSAEPFSKRATFDLNMAVENVDVPKVNPWLREYLKADAKSGDFDLFLEVASSNGHYEGFAKPMLENVQFLGSEDLPIKNANPLKSLWNATLQLAAEIFENQPRKQVAARVPFSGTVEGSQTDILATIASVLRNAFVGAFAHSIEERISLADVEDGGTQRKP